ncbi:transcriptional regulator, BadM/Rrf2 family [Parasphingorhabdus marina DSM 22363]|uniref:Transcriptional regulator, BadM/Rrf2 family n=1 Tax=Parasphingorhabdus marina DSM 22363 TaxID=1123272 RepID=A0A1N6CYW2_9SPHN|nr:Rrf2 family transcriptional regulator [Parasphingorhabdus marina]SIN63778.1 transcriptional regulator, BadM/Rrf2 family [Parasphingorhabdus marina DSM 22363]
MQISKGVEWAVHAAALLNGLPAGRGLKAEALARYHGVPAPYMAKQMQALSKAGITRSSRGAHGGYRLARPADQISLWDITAAVDGKGPAFRCTEIRQNGPCGLKPKDCKKACQIAAAFAAAERAFRESLAVISLADIAGQVVDDASPEHLTAIMQWLGKEAEPLSDSQS